MKEKCIYAIIYNGSTNIGYYYSKRKASSLLRESFDNVLAGHKENSNKVVFKCLEDDKYIIIARLKYGEGKKSHYSKKMNIVFANLKVEILK